MSLSFSYLYMFMLVLTLDFKQDKGSNLLRRSTATNKPNEVKEKVT